MRAEPARRVAEPVAGRPGGPGVGAVRDQGDGHEDRAQQEQLDRDAAARVVDELREHRGQEDERLGVGHADHEAVADDAQVAARRRGGDRRHRARRGCGWPGRRGRRGSRRRRASRR